MKGLRALCGMGALALPGLVLAQEYSLTDLGFLPGVVASSAAAVAPDGSVTGTIRYGTGELRAFQWSNGVIQDLGHLGGGRSNGEGISGGWVVGTSRAGDGKPHAFIWSQGSGMQDLGVLAGDESHASDVNGVGPGCGLFGQPRQHPCVLLGRIDRERGYWLVRWE